MTLDGQIEITPGVAVDRVRFVRWLRGHSPIGDVERRHYAHIAELTLRRQVYDLLGELDTLVIDGTDPQATQ